MSKKTMVTLMATGFLLVGVFARGAGAQTVQNGEQIRYLNTGLFTVARDEGASFHVSLDDRRSGAPTTVLLQLFNQDGAVVARKDVTLQPGQSTTLQINEPGLYRAHAQLREPLSSACERRTVIGIVEIFRAIRPTSPPQEDTTEPIILRMLLAHDDGRGSTCPQ